MHHVCTVREHSLQIFKQTNNFAFFYVTFFTKNVLIYSDC
jgi:hypothetical protein